MSESDFETLILLRCICATHARLTIALVGKAQLQSWDSELQELTDTLLSDYELLDASDDPQWQEQVSALRQALSRANESP